MKKFCATFLAVTLLAVTLLTISPGVSYAIEADFDRKNGSHYTVASNVRAKQIFKNIKNFVDWDNTDWDRFFRNWDEIDWDGINWDGIDLDRFFRALYRRSLEQAEAIAKEYGSENIQKVANAGIESAEKQIARHGIESTLDEKFYTEVKKACDNQEKQIQKRLSLAGGGVTASGVVTTSDCIAQDIVAYYREQAENNQSNIGEGDVENVTNREKDSGCIAKEIIDYHRKQAKNNQSSNR